MSHFPMIIKHRFVFILIVKMILFTATVIKHSICQQQWFIFSIFCLYRNYDVHFMKLSPHLEFLII